jgi:hypothetical protein
MGYGLVLCRCGVRRMKSKGEILILKNLDVEVVKTWRGGLYLHY